MSVKQEKKFVMKHTFTDVKNTEDDADLYGKEGIHFDIPWCITIYSDDYSAGVGMHLLCWKDKQEEKEWSLDTTILAKVFTNDGEKVFESKQVFTHMDNKPTYLHDLDPIDDYLVDGNLTIECHVTIHKMTGIEKPFINNFDDESAKEFSDVLLKVEDQKFYVYKMYLSYHSTYFKSLFLGNFDESKQSEVELKDIEPVDFQNFLKVIYAMPDINDKTVAGILKLADMYDAKAAIQQCEKFLEEYSNLDFKEKFLLAVHYKLENLKKKCMPEFKTSEDIAAVIPEDSEQFGSKVWKELLNLALEFNKKLAGK